MAIKQVEWKQEVNKELDKWWIRALLFCVLQGLLAWGSLSLMGNVWGIQDIKGSFRFLLLVLLISLGGSFLQSDRNPIRKQGKQKDKKRYKWLVFLKTVILFTGLGVVLWLLYGGMSEEWSLGWQLFGETYMLRWHRHVQEYHLSETDAALLQPIAEFVFLICILFAETMGGKKSRRKNILLVPISIICAGLLVMVVPEWSDLSLVLLSGVLLVCLENSTFASWKNLLILGAIMVTMLTVAGRFEESANEQMLDMNENWFEYWENFDKTLHEKVEDFEMPQWSKDTDVIDNSTPKFDEKPILTLVMSEEPVGTVYLRGYHCADYKDNVWRMDTKTFAKACKEYGIEVAKATEQLREYQFEQEEKAGSWPIDYEIHFSGNCDSYAYLPYASGWREMPENWVLGPDIVVTRQKSESQVSVTGWRQLCFPDGDMEAARNYSLFQEWYNDYVYENYLTVAEKQDEVRRLARELRKDEVLESYIPFLTPENHTPDVVNSFRLLLAHDVAAYLRRYGTYSLELDKLPWGEDAVEYFLENGMEGYCEHFASAGTLLLRELGVPARYVGGYVVRQGNILEVEGEYQATVLDSAAHAWTEIYLENYGWVPVEMTPGYSGVSEKPQTTELPEEPEPTEEPTAIPEEEPTEIPEGTENAAAPEEEGEPSQEDEDYNDERNLGEQVWNEYNSQGGVWGKLLVGFLVLAISFGAVFYYYLSKRKGHGMKRLAGYMRQGENRNAVRWINKLLYERTVETGRRKQRHSDDEYLTVLKETYPQIEEVRWDTYFTVVRRAVYSKEQITVEEAKLCCEIYKAVLDDSNK